jgi:hypothetical protein
MCMYTVHVMTSHDKSVSYHVSGFQMGSLREAQHLDPWHPDIECRTFDIEGHVRYRILRYRMHIRYRRFPHSISYIDIEGVQYRRLQPSISYSLKLRYRRSIAGYPISRFNNFDIDTSRIDIVCRYRIRYRRNGDIRYRRSCHVYRVRYRTRYCKLPMSFTAAQKLCLPRTHHACAEESRRHVPWIPAPSSCAIPQLDPLRFHEERSFHRATSTC